MKLVTKNPLGAAVAVYDYIQSLEDGLIISGQQEGSPATAPDFENQYIRVVSGKLPAIRGLDYISNDFDGVNKRAVDWWNRGGLVSICWHWGTPPYGSGYESSQSKIDLTDALDRESELHAGLVAQLDRAAAALKQLEKAGVPVLWRPYHEFDGMWFWWGKGTPEQFIDLWRLMFERFNGHWNLKNLIWVLGYADDVKDGWYPGDEYVDIIGSDTYKYGLHEKAYKALGKLTAKPRAFHECGEIPDPDALFEKGLNWRWFLTWHTRWITDNAARLKEIYNSDRVITLDKLPKFWDAGIETVSTKNAPAAIGPYSQAKKTGNFVFTSGQIPIDPATGEVSGADVTAQAELALKNLGAVLAEAGVSYENVVKTTCFLADMGDFAAFNAVYAKYFTENPARSCVAVKTLPKNVLVEVEAIAAV